MDRWLTGESFEKHRKSRYIVFGEAKVAGADDLPMNEIAGTIVSIAKKPNDKR